RSMPQRSQRQESANARAFTLTPETRSEPQRGDRERGRVTVHLRSSSKNPSARGSVNPVRARQKAAERNCGRVRKSVFPSRRMCFWRVDRRIAYGGFAGDEQTYARQVDVIKKAKQLLIANPSWCKYVRIASQPSTGKSQRGNPNDQHQHGSIECVR